MEISELVTFAEKENNRIFENYQSGYDLDKRILHAAVKATEELGELSEATLKFLRIQRMEKLNNFNLDDVADEVADSLLTVLILAHLMGVNVETALLNKMNKIENRYDVVGKEK